MKIVTWNVNGLRACVDKGFFSYLRTENADIICVQEVKMQEWQIKFRIPSKYRLYMNSGTRPGYAGTAIFSKIKPLSVYKIHKHGRLIISEFQDFILLNTYTVNSKPSLEALDERVEYDRMLLSLVLEFKKSKPVILCGDLNSAHRDVDTAMKGNKTFVCGCTSEERGFLNNLVKNGMVDGFRSLNPRGFGDYTWWSYQNNARQNNSGWRLDYFFIDERISFSDVQHRTQVLGSDHCPVVLTL